MKNKLFFFFRIKGFLMYCYILLTIFNSCSTKEYVQDYLKVSRDTDSVTQHPDIMRVISAEMFPNTSVYELTMLQDMSAEDWNCYKLANYAATLEMSRGGYLLLNRLRSGDVNIDNNIGLSVRGDWQESWELTPLPRVIFDFDGSVKYYEFGLIENGYVTATITVHAKREAANAIAFIFPYVLSYDHSSYPYFVGQYPYRCFYITYLL